jgi:hypothetical protein
MDQGFTVFGCIRQSMSVWARNIVSILVLGIIFFSPVIYYFVDKSMEVRSGADTVSFDFLWTVIVLTVVYAFDQFLAAPIIYGVVQELNGTHASVAACVWQGLKRIFSVFFTVFLLYWCVVFGTYPFVIPGIILATGMYVAVPCAVCERPGVMGTLTRSFELTEGSRMGIFGILLLFWTARVLAMVAANEVIDPQGDPGKTQMTLLVILGINFLFGTIGAVMQGVTYSRLRQVKDGVSTDDLAKIFE